MSPRRARAIQYPRSYADEMAWEMEPAHRAPVRNLPLVEYAPRFWRGDLIFDCPACCCEKAHAIRVKLPESEERVSVYELTVDGVIDVGCWRGRIEKGQVVSCT